MDSQTVFARLRDALANLYPTNESARRIADDAGLDARRIHFSAQALENWHAILAEAVRADRLEALLSIMLAEYASNGDLLAAYGTYRRFVEQGGWIVSPPAQGMSKDGQRSYYNRQAMLKLVYDIWVKGVLEHSLYNQLLIDLEMKQRPEAVERP